MAKRKRRKPAQLPFDHPTRRHGFLSEQDVRDMWALSDSYWREWLRTNKVPHRTIGGERWFQGDKLVAWFNSEDGGGEQ